MVSAQVRQMGQKWSQSFWESRDVAEWPCGGEKMDNSTSGAEKTVTLFKKTGNKSSSIYKGCKKNSCPVVKGQNKLYNF